MIIFCNCHLNQNNFQIVCHKATSQEHVMGFQIRNKIKGSDKMLWINNFIHNIMP